MQPFDFEGPGARAGRRRAAIVAAWMIALLGLAPLAAAAAQPGDLPADEGPPDEYSRATVVRVVSEREQEVGGYRQFTQVVVVRIATGPEAGAEVEAEYVTTASGSAEERLRVGDAVVLVKAADAGETGYNVVDTYRLPTLAAMLGLFFVLAIAFSRWRGAASIAGLGITLLVLTQYVVPQIVRGGNPLAVSLVAALAIALASISLAHGLTRRTTVALAGTLITLAIAAAMASLSVAAARLLGMGSEEALYLQLGAVGPLNLRGLLLGGIILGALGVLDDVTTAQAAAVDEISKANPGLSPRDLYRRGLSVGQEHIASLINTLVLAYAGASLPLFILFTLDTAQPLWVTLNSEFIAEEIIRTLVGSSALVLAVPITTLLAARRLRAKPGAAAPASDLRRDHAH